MSKPECVTIKKNDVLHKYPKVFSKLVWVQGLCVVHLLSKGKTTYTCSSAGTMELVDIPHEVIENGY